MGVKKTREPNTLICWHPKTQAGSIPCVPHLQLTPCYAHEKLEFFHSLSITSIFGPMHEVVNVGKNNN
jgi:hypothetical protein